jgi:murein DD-endopeptidase MepM/ murein hydrolase activator NlpD
MSASLCPSRRNVRAFVFFVLLAMAIGAEGAEALYHVLEKGETLYSIAHTYGISPIALAAANSINDPEHLRVGTKLLIPGATKESAPAASSTPSSPRTYKVAKDDTLYSIARNYGVSVEALRAANKLKSSSIIRSGDILELPSGATAPTGAAPVATSPSSTPGTTTANPPSTGPAMPDPVKTTVKPVSKALVWPCSGNILYMDGKVYGVLIKSKVGEAEKAVAAGTVSSAGPYRGYGNVVFVQSRTGHIYVYGGNDSLSVRAGDKVVAGQELGKVGMDLKQGGAAAYFLVFKDGEALDPAEAPRG